MNERVLLVMCTVSSDDEAKRIADQVLQARLAACVNIVPGLKSFFHWKGRIDEASELLLLIKTTKNAYPELEKLLVSLHSYDTPEIIALPLSLGFQKYLDWVNEHSKGK